MSELSTKTKNEKEEMTKMYKISAGKIDKLFFTLYLISSF